MKKLRFIEVHGFRLPPSFDPEIYRAATKHKPGKDQVVVASFPKCGTTWTLQIVMLILKKGIPPSDAAEYFSLLPFMEMTPPKYLQNLPKDACMKTHLPYNRVTFSKEAKYIYIVRHPADCVVSVYHHVRYFPIYFFSDGTFDELFELFISGECDFGDYFDHLLSWYEHRNEPNVLFITYEALKADVKGMILKIARFLGKDFYDTLVTNEEEILKRVLKYSSFEYMKNAVNKYWADIFSGTPPEQVQRENPVIKNYAELLKEANEAGHQSIGDFIRKGEVGDGKIVLSEEQRKRLEIRILEKQADKVVMDLWKRLT